ncbi:nucleotide disphospho-sugar-binding domain-containing protein [Streptomyces sp. XM4193]|uniref:nucleotide disphospho-sugar-binding domain-containing protein n=1 Tax=Streptomyces sp. XM4193 TaxID=2929782 RepID=UPI0024A639C6|nr:nucleotide disphospho-sugar-binding domain-containing protein [Streptomyces sp. XM4193]
MRVLICVWPAAAHLYPGVPLAWALRAAGHEVRVASHPSLADAVTGAGLTAVPLGDERTLPEPLGAGRPVPPDVAADLEQITKTLDLSGHERYLWSYHRDYMLPALRDFQPPTARADEPQPALDGLVDICRSWRPDLVLWDPTMPAAAVAAQVSGAAHARFVWGPDLFGWAHEQYARGKEQTGGALTAQEPLTASVAPMAARHGLAVTDELLLGQWTVNPVLEAMRLPTRARTVSVRWVPYTGSSTLPEWLYGPSAGPRVAITLGSSVRAWSQESGLLVNRVLEMVDGLDVEAVATLDATQLAVADRIPDNVRVIDYVPLSELLPTCSAVIHHGGHGTFGAALAARIPQFVVMDPRYPMEAPLTSRFLVGSGAGTGVRADRHSGAELRAGLARLIGEPSFAEAATGLYTDLLSAPGPSETVPVLERLTRHHRARA